jgi:serine/threonine protein kinase
MQEQNPNLQQLGNYRLIRLLGKGGFAKVYLGEHVHLQTNAAIKVLNEQDLSMVDQQGFIMEARTIRQLNHPHIVRVLDFGIEVSKFGPDRSIPYLVMEYLPGGTLRDRHPHGSMVPLQQIISYVSQVTDALQYAHDRDIVHLDIKPENMLEADPDDIQLGDFGIAITGHDSRKALTIKEEVILQGTIPYIAPERFAGTPHRSSDQYSLGIVVYEWLTGTRPFEGTQQQIISMHTNTTPPLLHEKYAHITKETEAVVLRALEKAPDQRYPSVKEFADALKNTLLTAPLLDLDQPPRQASPQAGSTGEPPSGPLSKSAPTGQAPQLPTILSVGPQPILPTLPANPVEQPANEPSTPPLVHSYQPSRQPYGEDIQQEGPIRPRPNPNRPQYSRVFSDRTHEIPPNSWKLPASASNGSIEILPFVQNKLQVLGKWIELDPEFATSPQNSFFRKCGMWLNFLSAIFVGLVQSPPSGWLIFCSLLFSMGFFFLCIRVVNPPLSRLLGLSVACYWGFVGFTIGVDTKQWYPSLSSLFPPTLLILIFFCISAYFHVRYVNTRLA